MAKTEPTAADKLAEALADIGEKLMDLADILQTVELAPADEPEPEEEEEKPKRGRGKKKDPEPEPEEEEEEKPKRGRGKKKDPEPEPEEDEEVTLEDLQELSAELLEAGERTTVRKILKEYDAKSVSDVDEEDYEDLYNELFDAVEALED